MIEYLDSLAEDASETPLILQHTLVFLRLCIASTAQQVFVFDKLIGPQCLS